MLVGTWVHGLFVFGQTPWALSTISNLPAMRGKQAAVFCTFALNPGKSLDKLTGAVQATGADVVGGLALSRSKLDEHSEIFACRLVGAPSASSVLRRSARSGRIANGQKRRAAFSLLGDGGPEVDRERPVVGHHREHALGRGQLGDVEPAPVAVGERAGCRAPARPRTSASRSAG